MGLPAEARTLYFLVALYAMLFTGLFLWTNVASGSVGTTKTVIAHRGASAYAPEHTRAAYELAIAQGADFVEQDLALTRDGTLICLHDDSLERTTDVEVVFPDRAVVGANGTKRWMVGDFTLAELRTLDAGSWFGPAFAGERILTWDEAIEIVHGRAGMYPELKTPALYRERGIDQVGIFVDAVRRAGLTRISAGARPWLVVQSFDEAAIRAMAAALPDVPRTLLIGDDRSAERWLSSADRVQEVAGFATGIGPAKQFIDRRPEAVRWAHDAGLTVTPYTFRATSTGRFDDVRSEMAFFLFDLDVDALFTDNPDHFPRQR